MEKSAIQYDEVYDPCYEQGRSLADTGGLVDLVGAEKSRFAIEHN